MIDQALADEVWRTQRSEAMACMQREERDYQANRDRLGPGWYISPNNWVVCATVAGGREGSDRQASGNFVPIRECGAEFASTRSNMPPASHASGSPSPNRALV